MKHVSHVCDICGREIWASTHERGYLAKRVSASLVNKEAREVSLEVSVYINGWSNGMDICWACGDEALQQAKQKLVSSAGER
jgi:hypothetical protein